MDERGAGEDGAVDVDGKLLDGGGAEVGFDGTRACATETQGPEVVDGEVRAEGLIESALEGASHVVGGRNEVGGRGVMVDLEDLARSAQLIGEAGDVGEVGDVQAGEGRADERDEADIHATADSVAGVVEGGTSQGVVGRRVGAIEVDDQGGATGVWEVGEVADEVGRKEESIGDDGEIEAGEEVGDEGTYPGVKERLSTGQDDS